MNQYMTTIVIPTIGRATLRTAVESAQAQLGGVVKEIIIAVDAKYKEVSLSLPQQSHKIPYKVVYGNKPGVSDTLNTAISAASTKLISWLSDDDIYTEIKLLDQINAIRKNGFTTSDLDNIFLISSFNIKNSETGHQTSHNPAWLINRFGFEPGYFALTYGFVSGCTVLFSKKLWKLSGKFPKEFRTTQDYVLWKRVLDRSPHFLYSEYPGTITNVHDGMESKSLIHVHKSEKENLLSYIYAGFLSKMQLHDLSIADQRQLYYTAPNEAVLFGSFISNNNESIKSLSKIELELNKICLLFIQEKDVSYIGYDFIADKTHLAANILRSNLYEKVGDVGTEYRDNELGYFVDSYWLNSKELKKICGISKSFYTLTSTDKKNLLSEALQNYRYVVVYNINKEFKEVDFISFLTKLREFDKSNELLPYHTTFDQIGGYDFDSNYRFFVRNPFLADSRLLK